MMDGTNAEADKENVSDDGGVEMEGKMSD